MELSSLGINSPKSEVLDAGGGQGSRAPDPGRRKTKCSLDHGRARAQCPYLNTSARKPVDILRGCLTVLPATAMRMADMEPSLNTCAATLLCLDAIGSPCFPACRCITLTVYT